MCVNGAIYLPVLSQKTILVFDIREESFSVVSLPQDFAQEFRDNNDIFHSLNPKAHTSIVEVGGCVGVCVGFMDFERLPKSCVG